MNETDTMETGTVTMVDTSGSDGYESNNIRFCTLCSKPIANESAFRRHVAYCRRTIGKPKKRKRSCKKCHGAKAKCSFEPQCFRCKSRGLICEYERPPVVSPGCNSLYDPYEVSTSTSDPSEGSPVDSWGSPGGVESIMSVFEGPSSPAELQTLPPPRLLSDMRTDPRQQASVLFLLDMLRALPHMMSRRETFPLFIHGHWQQPEPPKALLDCMNISRLYMASTLSPRDRTIYYTALAEETSHLMHMLPLATGFDLLAIFQVQIVYTMLVALEEDTPHPNMIPDLRVEKCHVDRTTRAARRCFEQDFYAPFDVDTIGVPNETWEEFIYAESRRRCALFWFLASRAIDLRYGLKAPPVLGYRGLALPCPDSLWTARTREQWEIARAEMLERRQLPLHSTSLRTFGDLVDIRMCSGIDSRRELNNWLSSCDKMGMMLLMASNMV
ncbi:hypothetical protein GGS20DRAFT_562317 [Poronia punctata]|nr:hypothetical protein GGS20DRAFT_562317 [Poronia punctata]